MAEAPGSTDYKAFWIEDALRNIVPPGRIGEPEGWDPRRALSIATADVDFDRVLDFGCGYGRVCDAFDPAAYVGVDLNPAAVARARREHPDYEFVEVDVDSPLPTADLCLAYMVLVHLDDKAAAGALRRMAQCGARAILIAEILGHEWRRTGNPPVFNRERQEYEAMARAEGFAFAWEWRRPYRRYVEDPAFQGRNSDVSLMLFQHEP